MAQLPTLGRLPTQLAIDELLAAEALSYVAGAWLSTAVLALLLLRVGVALHAARRFNRELAAQMGYLLGYLHYLPPTPPAAYLRELRLQHAHHLLETQACPSVAEAAYQSGFNDPSYFGQVFLL